LFFELANALFVLGDLPDQELAKGAERIGIYRYRHRFPLTPPARGGFLLSSYV
jgi:hypothetical protein